MVWLLLVSPGPPNRIGVEHVALVTTFSSLRGRPPTSGYGVRTAILRCWLVLETLQSRRSPQLWHTSPAPLTPHLSCTLSPSFLGGLGPKRWRGRCEPRLAQLSAMGSGRRRDESVWCCRRGEADRAPPVPQSWRAPLSAPDIRRGVPALGKAFTFAPSAFPVPLHFHVLLFLLRGLTFPFPNPGHPGWRERGRRWGRRERRWRRWRLSSHVYDSLNGGHDRILSGCLLQYQRVECGSLTSFAGKVNAFFQNGHLVSGVFVKGEGLLPRTPPPLLDKVIACLWLSLQPLGFQDLVHVIQVLLCGQDLGVVAHLAHLALDCFDFTALEPFFQWWAGCWEKRTETGVGQTTVNGNPPLPAFSVMKTRCFQAR